MAFLAALPAQAQAVTETKSVCYSPEQLAAIAQELQGHELCKKTLALREQFIEQAKLNPPPEQAWWQDPSVVMGGVVVSASVGLAIGLLVGQGKIK